MRPMLDDIELFNVQEITTHDRRILAEHKPPGMAGSLLQNMGRKPTDISVFGIAAGTDALQFVENLDGKFREGNPVTFVTDIIADAEIEQVIIDDLQWQEVAGKRDRYVYRLALRDYIEPVEPEDMSQIDTDIFNDAFDVMENLIDALDLLPLFDTGLERFERPLSTFLSRIRELP